MPWKECHVVDERLRFIARLMEGDKMAVVCEEFGISRKTGYKICGSACGNAGPTWPVPRSVRCTLSWTVTASCGAAAERGGRV